MDKSLNKSKKKVDIREFLILNKYLDARDSVDTWRVAQILDINYEDSIITINFDGWSHKWDEVS